MSHIGLIFNSEYKSYKKEYKNIQVRRISLWTVYCDHVEQYRQDAALITEIIVWSTLW